MFKKKSTTKFVISTTQSIFSDGDSFPITTYYTGFPLDDISSFNHQNILNGYLENALFFGVKKNAIKVASKLQKRIGGIYLIVEVV
tara:strand:+ start:60 stop:317 length:258 start_codon:yes stop_codon:yes gene_type:complete